MRPRVVQRPGVGAAGRSGTRWRDWFGKACAWRGSRRVDGCQAEKNVGKFPTSVPWLSRSPLSTRHQVVLDCALRILRPLVRLMLRHGVTYPAFAAALKPVFLDVARQELDAQAMPVTDSALTLLSGIHRRDVRALTREAARTDPSPGPALPLSLAGEVVGRWMSDAAWLDGEGHPRALARAEFDALVAGISQDVRPRALRDELVRLGAASLGADGSVALEARGFAPRQGFAEMAALASDNLADHAGAAAANLADGANFLEQALHVDRLAPASAAALHHAAAQAWQQVLPGLLRQAQALYEQDQVALAGEAAPAGGDASAGAAAVPTPAARRRVRMGVYFYETEDGSR